MKTRTKYKLKPIPLHDVPLSWLSAAIRTLDAPGWKITLARFFGRRHTNDGASLVGYEWRGKFYLTDYARSAKPPSSDKEQA